MINQHVVCIVYSHCKFSEAPLAPPGGPLEDHKSNDKQLCYLINQCSPFHTDNLYMIFGKNRTVCYCARNKKNEHLLFFVPERSFVCCMQTSKAFKQQQGSCCSVLVRGTFHSFPQPCPSTSAASSVPGLLFVALCTPTVDRLRSSEQHLCHSFRSAHQLDMTFAHLSERFNHISLFKLISMSSDLLLIVFLFCFISQCCKLFGVFSR